MRTLGKEKILNLKILLSLDILAGLEMKEIGDKGGALFRIVAVGGTFDELHKGHKALLTTAFKHGENVWIGLCTDEFAKKLRKNHEIASYEDRAKELAKFLNNLGVSDRAKIIPLSDPYGLAAISAEIEAIVVSRETEPRARELNFLRLKSGLKPLEIIVIDMVPAEDQTPISTTRIRRGEIDREGKLLRK